MKRVRYDGRGRLLVHGYELRRGDSGVMSDEQAAELAANPRIEVTVTDETRRELSAVDEPEAGDGEGQPTDPHPQEEE